MNEKEELTQILKNYESTTIDLYKKITKIEKENQNKARRTDIRNKIRNLINEVVK